MFGSGRIAFAAICQSVTMIDSSPRRLEMTSPATKTWSPRSTSSFHSLQRLLAHLGERDHRLDAAAVAGLQRREAELAGVAAEARRGRRRPTVTPRLGSRFEVAEALAQLGDGVGDRHGDRVGASPRLVRSAISRSRLASRTAFCSEISSR